jgi:hypothetical protein
MTATSRCQCDHSSDHAKLHRAWAAVAEAEGFEPPVPSGTLAFKLRAATYGGSHEAHYQLATVGNRRNPDG